MSDPITLVRPNANADLVVALKEIVEQAERAEFTRCIIVKLRADHSFAVRGIGVGSDLAMAGALTFALHDLIKANTPAADK